MIKLKQINHFENLLQKISGTREKNKLVEDEPRKTPLHFQVSFGNWKGGNYFVSSKEKSRIQMRLLWNILVLGLMPKMLVTRNYPEI